MHIKTEGTVKEGSDGWVLMVSEEVRLWLAQRELR